MPSTISNPITRLYLLITSGMLLLGCSSTPKSPRPSSPQEVPIAIINGRAISASSIDPAARESAGRRVLLDIALDHELKARCAQRGIVITQDMLADERSRIGDALGLDQRSSLPANLLDSLRAQRGLGPVRFEQLLRRNAMLRTLIGTQNPSPNRVEQAIQEQFGPEYRIRLFVSDSPTPASTIRDAVMNSNNSQAKWVFADHCATDSTHPSASRGGLIESISPASMSYPQSLRDALVTTPVGTCSKVFSTEAGFAVIYVEDLSQPNPPTQTERKQIENQLRQSLQRQAMQQLAQNILESQDVIVLDKSLHWSWANSP
jgi:hypothetical protein